RDDLVSGTSGEGRRFGLARARRKQTIALRARRGSKEARHNTQLCDRQSRRMPLRNHEWLWSGHLVRGNLELMAGIKGVGKSQIHCQYAGIATTGRPWPNGVAGIIPCRVIMVTAEDSTEDTLKPRLMAAFAELKLIEEFKGI